MRVSSLVRRCRRAVSSVGLSGVGSTQPVWRAAYRRLPVSADGDQAAEAGEHPRDRQQPADVVAGRPRRSGRAPRRRRWPRKAIAHHQVADVDRVAAGLRLLAVERASCSSVGHLDLADAELDVQRDGGVAGGADGRAGPGRRCRCARTPKSSMWPSPSIRASTSARTPSGRITSTAAEVTVDVDGAAVERLEVGDLGEVEPLLAGAQGVAWSRRRPRSVGRSVDRRPASTSCDGGGAGQAERPRPGRPG